MTDLVTAVAVATILASGTATRYDPGVMDTVVANRVMYGQIDADAKAKGYIALLDCRDLGREVWLQRGGRVDGPYLVADCAAEKDFHRLRAMGWAVDLSWEVAVDWGVVNRPMAGFRVWSADPRLSVPWHDASCQGGDRQAQ